MWVGVWGPLGGVIEALVSGKNILPAPWQTDCTHEMNKSNLWTLRLRT